MTEEGVVTVGHPDEVRPAIRRMARDMALRATRGLCRSFTLATRESREPAILVPRMRGVQIWDVWDDRRLGGGPPRGVCYGSIVVDTGPWRDRGGEITISESSTEHARVLLAQPPRG